MSSTAQKNNTYCDITLPNGNKLSIPTGLFIDNEFVPSVDGGTLETVDPATEDVICTFSAASEKDIDLAVAAARKAFKTTWGLNTAGPERSKLLGKLADLIERDSQVLAELESFDNGKPVRIARDADIGDSIACLRYYAGWADKITGQTIETSDTSKFAYTRHEPVGVCGQIIPWNYPIMMWAWKVGPALATGCTIVMKPSENTPLTALKLCELIVEAGYPPGVVNCVPSLGNVGGAALASHPEVDKVAFTGSTLTGRKIMEAAAKSNLKKVTLELGGKSPSLVFESANLEEAARWALMGVLYNTGQDCTAGSRVYVQNSIYEKFTSLLKENIKAYKVGQGFKEETSAGPIISKVQYDKVLEYIAQGEKAGATILYKGSRPANEKGYFIEPVVFADVKSDMKIVQEEIFGPVLSIGRFDTEEDAVALANNTTYGLGAALYSNDASQCMRVSALLQAGTVWVNHYGLLHASVPFGGFKQSGIGRELSAYALSEYTNVKSVLWNIFPASGESTAPWPL